MKQYIEIRKRNWLMVLISQLPLIVGTTVVFLSPDVPKFFAYVFGLIIGIMSLMYFDRIKEYYFDLEKIEVKNK